MFGNYEISTEQLNILPNDLKNEYTVFMMPVYVKNHRDYLKNELAARVNRRPFYSQRAFARDLGISPSTLTDFLKGRIGFSVGRVNQLCKLLNLSHEQKAHWNDLQVITFGRDPEQIRLSEFRIQARLQAEENAISLDEFKAISEWHYLAILELIEMNPIKYSEVKELAKSLDLTQTLIKSSLQRLISLHLIKVKNIEPLTFEVNSNTQIGTNTPSEAIRNFHRQILDKATKALDKQSINRRFQSSTLVGLPKNKVADIQNELKTLAYKILTPHIEQAKLLPKEELYCLSIQFFDLLKQGPTYEN